MPELFGRSYSRPELLRRVGRLDQVAGVRLVTLGDGGARGVRVLEFRTGSGFAFDVLVDRAFDIGRCELRGVVARLDVGGRRRRALVLRAGRPRLLPHLRRRPADDLRHRPRAVHGRGHGGAVPLPAEADRDLRPARSRLEPAGPPRGLRRALGRRRRARSGPRARRCRRPSSASSSLLRRRIEARVGESRLRIHDVVENVGHDLTPHMLLYHVNVGFPVVDEGSELLVPALGRRGARRPSRRGLPDDGGARGAATSSRCSSTSSSRRPPATSSVAVVNRRLGVGVYEVFRQDQLPHHFVWRTLGEGTYVVGIEPCTNRTAGRLDARDRGELIELAAGESRTLRPRARRARRGGRDRRLRGQRRGRRRLAAWLRRDRLARAEVPCSRARRKPSVARSSPRIPGAEGRATRPRAVALHASRPRRRRAG